ILSFSQTAWFVLIITSTCLFLNPDKLTKAFKFIIAVIFLLSLSLPLVSKYLVQNYKFEESIQKRLELNIVSGALISQKPLLGVGLGNFIPASSQVYRQKGGGLIKNVSWFLQPVHNIFILVLVETGIVGIIIFYLVICKAILNKGLALLLLSIVFSGMTDHYWLTLQQNQLLLAIVIGIIFSFDTITSWKKKS
ncbi:O-antigen ligase family protein, partial [Candidatus Microgenomates bacterium]|nr:O-antigen ligase family protein [Candidatus Microgenomates bacterium]